MSFLQVMLLGILHHPSTIEGNAQSWDALAGSNFDQRPIFKNFL